MAPVSQALQALVPSYHAACLANSSPSAPPKNSRPFPLVYRLSLSLSPFQWVLTSLHHPGHHFGIGACEPSPLLLGGLAFLGFESPSIHQSASSWQPHVVTPPLVISVAATRPRGSISPQPCKTLNSTHFDALTHQSLQHPGPNQS